MGIKASLLGGPGDTACIGKEAINRCQVRRIYNHPGLAYVIWLSISNHMTPNPDFERPLPEDYQRHDKIVLNLPWVTEVEGKLVLPFVNREDEIGLFRKAVSAISDDSEKKTMARHILNFWGAGGIGKTRLLRDKLPKILNQEPKWKQQWDYVYLSLEEDQPDIKAKLGEAAITDLEKCLKALAACLSIKLNLPLEQIVNSVGKNEIELADKLAEVIKERLNQDPSRRLMIILDGLTQTKDWFAKLEKHFISPLIKNILLVIGSRAAVRLDRFELRLQLIKSSAVKPFEPKNQNAIADLMYTYFTIPPKELPSVVHQLKEMSRDLLTLSKGHPDALRFLLQKLSSNLETATYRLKEERDKLEVSLSDYILETYVRGDGLATREAHLQAALKEMSIYRRFDITMLQNACQHAPDPYVQKQFANQSSAYFTQLSQDLVRTYLVDWKIERRGFVIEESYRTILEQGLEAAVQQEEPPEHFQERHNRAIKLYEELITKTQEQTRPENETLKIYKAELKYHQEKALLKN